MPDRHPRILARASAVLLAAMMLVGEANAAEIASDVDEGRLTPNNAGQTLAAFDDALAALWTALPLQARVALFADSVTGFGNYRRRPAGPLRPGDRVTIYVEPVGYGFIPSGDGFRVALAIDTEIRTPGGLVLGKAPDFARLEWNARSRLHEVHATLAFALPKLKQGDYELVLTLRDQGSWKTGEITLPFVIAGEPPLE